MNKNFLKHVIKLLIINNTFKPYFLRGHSTLFLHKLHVTLIKKHIYIKTSGILFNITLYLRYLEY
jgi:hypothetical protein